MVPPPKNIQKSMAAFKLFDMSAFLDNNDTTVTNERTFRYYKFHILTDGIYDLAQKYCVAGFTTHYMQQNDFVYVQTNKVKVNCCTSIIRKL